MSAFVFYKQKKNYGVKDNYVLSRIRSMCGKKKQIDTKMIKDLTCKTPIIRFFMWHFKSQ